MLDTQVLSWGALAGAAGRLYITHWGEGSGGYSFLQGRKDSSACPGPAGMCSLEFWPSLGM